MVQFLIATHLRTTIFKSDKVDLLMYDSMPAAKQICNNIKKSGFYNDVYIVSSVLAVGITKIGFIDKIIKYLRWFELQIAPLHGTRRDIKIANYKYDAFVFCANGIFLEGLYNVCRRENPQMHCLRYEGSLTSYLHDHENAKGRFRRILESCLKKFSGSVDLSEEVEKYYFFEPSLIQFQHNYQIEKIPLISSIEPRIIGLLNSVFEFDIKRDYIKENTIAFEDGNLYFMNNNEEVELFTETAKVLGKENFLVKLHPRNNIDRFSSEIVTTNKSIAPWEVYLMNQNISGKTLITSASGSIFTSLLYFGMDVKIILVYKIVKQRIPLIDENFERLLNSLVSLQENRKHNLSKVYLSCPKSIDEYFQELEKLHN